MKKSLFTFIVFTSISALLLLTKCSKPVDTNCIANEDTIIGGYNGDFSILGGAYVFDDSLTITNPIADDRKISIKSEKLGTTLIGTFDNKNCNRIILDSIIIASQVIETVTLTNIRAAGSGTFSGNSISTVINIKSGSALIGTLVIPLAGQSLTGTFSR